MPPCARAIFWHTASPSPVPLGLVVKNGRKHSAGSAVSPGPRSSTYTDRSCGEADARHMTSPPSGEASIAFSSRLKNTCFIESKSATIVRSEGTVTVMCLPVALRAPSSSMQVSVRASATLNLSNATSCRAVR